MTTTNRAFIKVYRHDAAELAPAAPTIAEAERPTAAALCASIEFAAATMDCQLSSADLPSTKASLFATSIDVLAPPAEPPAATPFPFPDRPSERRLEIEQSPTSRRRIDRPKSGKKPLSTFLAPQHSARRAAAYDTASAYRAGTTVASFRWPSVCRVLSQQCGAEFDRVVDVLLSHAARGRSITGILGMFPGIGCTTTALCLAARLAGRGIRALLVDGNFYGPRLATWLDVVPTAGWQEVLETGAAVTDAIVRSVDDHVDVLALSETRPNDPLQLIALPQTTRTAALLRQAYDLVLVDLGAFFDPRSQPITLELVRRMGIDTALIVAGPTAIDPRDSATVAEYIGENGCEVLGIVENQYAKPQAIGSSY